MGLFEFFRSLCGRRQAEIENDELKEILLEVNDPDKNFTSIQITRRRATTTSNTSVAYQRAQESHFTSSDALIAGVLVGAGRDFFWRDGNRFENSMPEFVGSTLTQMIQTLLPIAGASHFSWKLLHETHSFIKIRRQGMHRIAGISLASWLSIPFWNLAEWGGTWLGREQLSFNPAAAGYFSGIATGVIETIIQNGFIAWWEKQPLDYWVTTLMTLAGAMWKWIKQANTVYDPNHPSTPLPSSPSEENMTNLQIMLAVAATTIIMTLLGRGIKQACSARAASPTQELELVAEIQEERKEEEEEIEINMDGYDTSSSLSSSPSSSPLSSPRP